MNPSDFGKQMTDKRWSQAIGAKFGIDQCSAFYESFTFNRNAECECKYLVAIWSRGEFIWFIESFNEFDVFSNVLQTLSSHISHWVTKSNLRVFFALSAKQQGSIGINKTTKKTVWYVLSIEQRPKVARNPCVFIETTPTGLLSYDFFHTVHFMVGLRSIHASNCNTQCIHISSVNSGLWVKFYRMQAAHGKKIEWSGTIIDDWTQLMKSVMIVAVNMIVQSLSGRFTRRTLVIAPVATVRTFNMCFCSEYCSWHTEK